MDVIEVNNLVKRYKELTAVENLSFKVKDKQILGLLGPNGSGKTTTINCILSLLKYDEGKISIFGQPMSPAAYDIKKKIGVVFQDVAVLDELTVYENIDYFCGLYISDKQKRHQYVQEAIEFVGLHDYQKFLPKKLSGGLLRRLNIACGIAHKPELIFFDEPTVAVDPQSRNNILEGIKKLNELGATIIYTSHYMEEVEILCDEIIILDKGQIIAQGTSEQLKEKTAHYEKVMFEGIILTDDQLTKINSLENIIDLNYQDYHLTIKFTKSPHNLINILHHLTTQGINFEKIYNEQPTLNDVFLEITGKELRD